MTDSLIIHLFVFAYLGIMVLVGVMSKKFIHSAKDFFNGGRVLPWWVASISLYMGAFSALSFVALGSVAFNQGVVGLLIAGGGIFGLIFAGLVLAPRWHRAGILTPIEYLEGRFGVSSRQIMAWISVIINPVATGLRLYAFAVMVNGVMGYPLVETVIVAGGIMLAYTLLGGLWAVVLTDAVQFIVLLVGLIPLLILSLFAFDAAPENYTIGDLFVMTSGSLGWGWLVTWWLVEAININFSFQAIQRYCSVPTEKDAKKAAYFAGIMLIPTPFMAFIPAMVAYYLFPEINGETAFAHMATQVLPAGLLGLMLGAMFSATMSSLDSSFNVDSGIMTHDIYARFINQSASRKKLLMVSRVATVIAASMSIFMALILAFEKTGVFEFLEVLQSRWLVALWVPFLLGVFLKRVQQSGYFFAMVGGLTFSLVLWLMEYSPADARLPVILSSGFFMLVANGLFPAKGKKAESIDLFFIRLKNDSQVEKSLAIGLSEDEQKTEKEKNAERQKNVMSLIGNTCILVGFLPILAGIFSSDNARDQMIELVVGTIFWCIGGGLIMLGGHHHRSNKASHD